MNIIYLQLGSNLGDRLSFLKKAISEIISRVGKLIKQSEVYESSPWKVDGQPNYLNQLIQVKTKHNAKDTLNIILDIEHKLGRKRVEKWGERLIDIDIIFFNSDIIETIDLCVPHKHLHERRFVLLPLNEIAKDYIHPRYNMSVCELLNQCSDNEYVERYVK